MINWIRNRHWQKADFVRDEDGATTVEFVLVAAPFFSMLLFLLSLGYVFLVSAMLEDSAQEASRQIRIGAVAASSLSKDDFKKMLCEGLPVSQSECEDNIVITVTSEPDFSDLDTSEPTSNGELDLTQEEYDPGEASDYVFMRSILPLSSINTFFGLLGNSSNAQLVVSSAITFRSEPY